MLTQIATIIAPLFLCAGIGVAWGRLDAPFNAEMISRLALDLAMPCLIFSTLTRLDISPAAFGEMAGAYALALAGMMAAAVLVVRLAGLEFRAYVPALTFPNSGNMGMPLSLFAFGEPGLALAIAVFVIGSICGLTIGGGLYSGRTSYRMVTHNPLVYVIAAAVLLMVLQVRVPAWFANTVELIGGMSIPLMILALGVAVGRLRVTNAARSLALAALKLAIGFAVGMAVSAAFGFEGVARGVLILTCSMPTAVHNYVFAQRYERSPSEVAGMVLMSTALSYATLPLLLMVVL